MSWKALLQYGHRNNFLIQKFYRQYPIYNPTDKQVVIMVEGKNHRLTKPYNEGSFEDMLEVLAKSVCRRLAGMDILYWRKITQYAEKNGLEIKHRQDFDFGSQDYESCEFEYMVYVQIGDLMYRKQCNSENNAELNFYKGICKELNIGIEELQF